MPILSKDSERREQYILHAITKTHKLNMAQKKARLLRTAPLGYGIFILKLPQAALNGMLFHLYLTCRRTLGLRHLRQLYGEHAVVYSGCDSLLHQKVQASLL